LNGLIFVDYWESNLFKNDLEFTSEKEGVSNDFFTNEKIEFFKDKK
jgi:hypothetical protein